MYVLFRSTFSNTSGLRCSAARYLLYNILFYFFCSGIQGYLKHSSNKCVGVNAGKLVFETSCTSAEQVFYKEKFSSFLIHVASGKCVANPDPVGAV